MRNIIINSNHVNTYIHKLFKDRENQRTDVFLIVPLHKKILKELLKLLLSLQERRNLNFMYTFVHQ